VLYHDLHDNGRNDDKAISIAPQHLNARANHLGCYTKSSASWTGTSEASPASAPGGVFGTQVKMVSRAVATGTAHGKTLFVANCASLRPKQAHFGNFSRPAVSSVGGTNLLALFPLRTPWDRVACIADSAHAARGRLTILKAQIAKKLKRCVAIPGLRPHTFPMSALPRRRQLALPVINNAT
jgi:hypothetical protein